ncbi:DUF6207 family protein [Streptomyces poriticola]
MSWRRAGQPLWPTAPVARRGEPGVRLRCYLDLRQLTGR